MMLRKKGRGEREEKGRKGDGVREERERGGLYRDGKVI